VRISDTGEQTAHRIANPDLGLPLANALVRLYDGRLTIDRGPVRGTTVTVWLSRGLIPRENDRHGAGSEVAAPSEAF
jgi:signal transduction histidine kinase